MYKIDFRVILFLVLIGLAVLYVLFVLNDPDLTTFEKIMLLK